MSKAVFLLIFVLLLSGCTQGNTGAVKSGDVQSPETFKSQLSDSCRGCNVLIIGIDTLRPDHSSAFGYSKDTTPNLAEFADESYVFSNAISAAPWTVPSFMTMFTGAYPSDHKVVNKYEIFDETRQVISNLKKLSPEAVTLTEMLKSYNYSTAGFTGDAGVSAQFGYGSGFDYYLDDKAFAGLDHSANPALEWLKANKTGPFYMFLHGYDLHGQYDITGSFSGRFLDFDYNGSFTGSKKEEAVLREKVVANEPLNLTGDDARFWLAVYDEKVYNADQRFGQFWREFKEMGLDRNTIVIIVSDHGEEFYEHQMFDHGHSLYDELIHTALIMHLPSGERRVVTDQVRTIDILPTIFDILGKPVPANAIKQVRGESLVPVMSGGHWQRDAFSETDYRLYTHKRSIRTYDGWKFIKTFEDGRTELYNLNTDPGEQANLNETQRQKAYELEQKLYVFMRMTNQDENKLKILGCLPVYPEECK
ncbi:MAG: sulfatase [Candidatus Aenigmarchaeota archaeon]|nr:sulfatase [Candidatus Aenigmarchaeota archaeon]